MFIDGEEQDFEEVAAEAYAEMEAEANGDETGSDESNPKKKEDSEDEATQDQEQGEQEGEEETQDGDDSDSEESDKDGENEGSDDSDENESDEITEEEVQEHAEKQGLTLEEAKDDLEKTNEIIKRYKNDPKEMARAMRNKDREFSKLQGEVQKKQEKPQVFRRMSDDAFRDYARKQLEGNEDIIEKFRQKFPAKAERMEDSEIVEESVEKALDMYHTNADKKEAELKTQASKKRIELVSSIDESDRRFVPDVKAVLNDLDDVDVLTSEGLLEDALNMAKGKRYDQDIKAAEERGSKRAKEGAKIVGVKSGKGGAKPKSKGSVSLTSKQKDQALDMYGSDCSDEESYKMFQETFAEELKKNANYIPY